VRVVEVPLESTHLMNRRMVAERAVEHDAHIAGVVPTNMGTLENKRSQQKNPQLALRSLVPRNADVVADATPTLRLVLCVVLTTQPHSFRERMIHGTGSVMTGHEMLGTKLTKEILEAQPLLPCGIQSNLRHVLNATRGLGRLRSPTVQGERSPASRSGYRAIVAGRSEIVTVMPLVAPCD
jgi:hypothetical protein